MTEPTELSRLRAFALRIGPIVKAAIELRELGRSMERLEDEMNRRNGLDHGTRSATPWLILNQAYETALQEFDAKVKRAALGDFVDLLGDTYHIFDPKKTKPHLQAKYGLETRMCPHPEYHTEGYRHCDYCRPKVTP